MAEFDVEEEKKDGKDGDKKSGKEIEEQAIKDAEN